MARPESTIELTDTEKRDLITLIQAGKPLPEKTASCCSRTSARSAVKVIDIFGNDTMKIVPVNLG